MSLLTAITVTHNSTGVLPDFFDAMGAIPSTCELVVVDSGSNDAVAVRSAATEYGAVFVDAGGNVGYGTGSNRGAEGRASVWLAVINPDVLVTWDTLLRLVEVAANHGLSCVGPQLLDLAGSRVRSWHALMSPPWIRSRVPVAVVDGDVTRTQAISGCAMVVRRDVFDSLGGFDENFFMFAEEQDFLRRLGALGGSVGVANELFARTSGGGSSTASRRWSVAERSVGHIRYMRKHFGLGVGIVDLVMRCAHAAVDREFRPARDSIRQIVVARPLSLSRRSVTAQGGISGDVV